MLPSKKIQKRDIIRMILAGIYMLTVDMNYFVRLASELTIRASDLKVYLQIEIYIVYIISPKKCITYAFYIDVNIVDFN